MTADGLQIDPAQIKGSIPAFTTQAEHLRTAVAAFKAELAGLGAPWGNDENGREFGATFVQNQTAITTGGDNLAQGMASIGPTLVALVDNVTRTDGSNAEKLS